MWGWDGMLSTSVSAYQPRIGEVCIPKTSSHSIFQPLTQVAKEDPGEKMYKYFVFLQWQQKYLRHKYTHYQKSAHSKLVKRSIPTSALSPFPPYPIGNLSILPSHDLELFLHQPALESDKEQEEKELICE